MIEKRDTDGFTGRLLAALGALCFCVSVAAQAPDAAAFDAFVDDLENARVPLGDDAATAAASAKLHALLPPGDARRQRLLYGTACWLDHGDDPDAGQRYSEEKLAEVRAAGDTTVEIRLLYCLAGYAEGNEGSNRAMALYEEGIALADRHGDLVQKAWGLSFRGLSRSTLGDQATGLADLLEAQSIFESAELTDAAEGNAQSIAIAYRRMGLFPQALEYLHNYLAYATARGERAAEFSTHLQIGYAYEESQRMPQAREAVMKALSIAKETAKPRDIAMAELALSAIDIAEQAPKRALRRLARAETRFAEANDDSSLGLLQLYRGQALARLGQINEALALLNEAERTIHREDNPRYLAMLLRERAAVRESAGQTAGALRDLQEYIALRETLAAKLSAEQTRFLTIQFDVSRRDLENERLRAEKASREAELEAAARTRNWQTLAILLATALCVVLAAFAFRQIRRSARLRALALTDPLTGLPNRRAMDSYAEQAIDEVRQSNGALAVLTMDIDFFKRINDTFGHAIGDQVLVRVAKACHQALRQQDRIARTGGEEFAIILPQTGLAAASEVAQRVCDAVSATPMEDIAEGLRATISIGVAEFTSADRNLNRTLQRADNALYRAKAAGRNRVEIEPTPE